MLSPSFKIFGANTYKIVKEKDVTSFNVTLFYVSESSPAKRTKPKHVHLRVDCPIFTFFNT